MSDFAPTIEKWLTTATDKELEDARGLDHVRRDPNLAQRIRGEQQRRERNWRHKRNMERQERHEREKEGGR